MNEMNKCSVMENCCPEFVAFQNILKTPETEDYDRQRPNVEPINRKGKEAVSQAGSSKTAVNPKTKQRQRELEQRFKDIFELRTKEMGMYEEMPVGFFYHFAKYEDKDNAKLARHINEIRGQFKLRLTSQEESRNCSPTDFINVALVLWKLQQWEDSLPPPSQDDNTELHFYRDFEELMTTFMLQQFAPLFLEKKLPNETIEALKCCRLIQKNIVFRTLSRLPKLIEEELVEEEEEEEPKIDASGAADSSARLDTTTAAP